MEWLLEASAEEGIALNIDEKPELFSDLQPVWEAFQVLHSHRQQGFSGPCSLSITDICAYHRSFDCPVEIREFEFLVRRMDRAFLDYIEEKREEENKRRAKS